MPPSASEHMEPRLVRGASTPTPKKDMKDSVKMADGICRQVVATIWPMQLGSRCRLMIRPLEAPRARAAVTYSCFLRVRIWPRMMRLIPTQYRQAKAMNMPIRLGPTFLKNSARKKPWWSVMNWVTWGPMAVAMSRMISTSGRE